MPEIKLRPIVFKVTPPPYDPIGTYSVTSEGDEWWMANMPNAQGYEYVVAKFTSTPTTRNGDVFTGGLKVKFVGGGVGGQSFDALVGWNGRSTSPFTDSTADSLGLCTLFRDDAGTTSTTVADANGVVKYSGSINDNSGDWPLPVGSYVETANPVQLGSLNTSFNGKLIIDMTNKTMYCYIGGVAVGHFTPTIDDGYTSNTAFYALGYGTCNLDLYGCHTLEAAIQC